MIRKQIWRGLSIGEVELFDDKITVRADVDFKGLEKKYKDLVGGLTDESRNLLANTFEKKKTRVLAFKAEKYAELEAFFKAIGDKEGVKVEKSEEPEREKREEQKRSETKEKGSEILVASVDEVVSHEMSHEGDVKSIKGSGAISVTNRARNQPVWDVNLNVDGGDNTDLPEKQFHVNELRPGEDWKKEYSMTFKEGTKPPILVSEVINTAPSGEQPSIVYVLDTEGNGQVTSIKIDVSNASQKPANTIKIVKEIPNLFGDVEIGSPSKGNARREQGQVIWTIDDLGATEKATLEFNAKAFAKEITRYPSGDIDVEYRIDADTRASLRREKLNLGGTFAYFIDLDERDAEPDMWDGKFVIQNRSEFPMHLGEVKIKLSSLGKQEGAKPEESLITLDANVDVDPGNEWTSEPFTIESVTEPGFNDELLALFKDIAVGFSIGADIQQKTTYRTHVEPIDLAVLSIEGTKTFDTYAVKSYRDNVLHALINVKTRGKAPVASIHLLDTIPRDFQNPDAKEIEVRIAGKKVDPSLYSVAFTGVENTTERKMAIDIKDIAGTYGDIEDGTAIDVKYPVLVHNPQKDTMYETESVFQAFLTLPGPPIECKMRTSEKVQVIHQRRRTTVGKSIAPGAAKGEYAISLVYRNKATFNKTGIVVSDFVPKGFDVTGQSEGCNVMKKADGTMLTWTFDVEAGKEFEMSYSVKGKSDDASLKEIEAKSFK
nr:hypothetical protein [Candidatus Sigynarchaeota archaeon]